MISCILRMFLLITQAIIHAYQYNCNCEMNKVCGLAADNSGRSTSPPPSWLYSLPNWFLLSTLAAADMIRNVLWWVALCVEVDVDPSNASHSDQQPRRASIVPRVNTYSFLIRFSDVITLMKRSKACGSTFSFALHVLLVREKTRPILPVRDTNMKCEPK